MEIHKCIVNGCVNKSDDIIHYCLPEDPQRRQQWQVFIERSNPGEQIPDSCHICSEHFTEDCFTNIYLGFTTRSILNVDAIPTIYETVCKVVSVESAEESGLAEEDRAGTVTADGNEELTDPNPQLNHLSHSFNSLKEEPLHFNIHSEVNRLSESFHSTKEENGGEENFAEGYDQIRVVEVDYSYPVKEGGEGEVYALKEEEEEVYGIKKEEGGLHEIEYSLPEEKMLNEYMKKAGLEESDKEEEEEEEGGMYIIEYSNPEEEEEQGGGKFALEFSYKGEEGGGEFVIEYHNEEEEEEEDEDEGGFDKLLYDLSPVVKEEKKIQNSNDWHIKKRMMDDQSPVLIEEKRIKKEKKEMTMEEIWLEENRLEERTNMMIERWKEERLVAEENKMAKHWSNEETVERKKRAVGYHCHVCSETFQNRGSFLDHQDSHPVSVAKEPKPYKCDICPNTYFDTKKRLKYHLRDHHEGRKVKRNPTRKIFFCDVCKTDCRNQVMLDTHARRHANQNMVYHCAFCPGEQKGWGGGHGKGEILKHYQREHPKMIPRCDLCQQGFGSLNSYLLHYTRHTAVTPWYCKECKIYQQTERGLRVHLKNDGLRRIKEQRLQAGGQPVNPEANSHTSLPAAQNHAPLFDDPASPSENQLQDLQAPLPENSASSLESPTPKPDDPATRIIS